MSSDVNASQQLYTAIRDTLTSMEREFTKFPDLPAELRVEVWKCAIADTVSSRPTTIRQIPSAPYMAKEAPPALLHVNRESRCEAEKVYTRRTITFQNNTRPPMILFFDPWLQALLLDVGPTRLPPSRTTDDFCPGILQSGYVTAYCQCGSPFDPRCTTFDSRSNRNSTPDPACPHGCVIRRQAILLKNFVSADTSAIQSVALRLEGARRSNCVGTLMRRLDVSFPHLRRTTFILGEQEVHNRALLLYNHTVTAYLWSDSLALVLPGGVANGGMAGVWLWVFNRVTMCWVKFREGIPPPGMITRSYGDMALEGRDTWDAYEALLEEGI